MPTKRPCRLRGRGRYTRLGPSPETWIRSAAKSRRSASQGKKITTVNSRCCPVAATPSQSRACVAVTRASSQTPWGADDDLGQREVDVRERGQQAVVELGRA